MYLLLFSFSACSFTGNASAQSAVDEFNLAKWTPWFEIGGVGGSDDRSRAEATLWTPLMQSQSSVLFADVRGKFFFDDEQEGNFALGYRQMLTGGWNLGAWIGYDVRHTEYGSNFDQVSFGVEALHPIWDIRFNGYVPLEDKEFVGSQSSVSVTGQTLSPTAQLIGNNVFLLSGGFTTTTTTTSELYELGFWGVDGEIGLKLPLDLGVQTELRAYAGGFYFEHDDFDDTIAGPRGRLEYRIDNIIPEWSGSRLTLEAAAQWDDVRGDLYEGGARLRLPFGGSGERYASLTAQEKRMMEGLERDTDIVTETTTTTSSSSATTGSALVQEEVEDAITGVDFEKTVVAAGGGANLQNAITTGGQNTLVIGQGGAAFTNVVMQDNQTLQGGGSTIQVRGLTSGTVVDFTAPGSTPTINGGGLGAIVTADKSHIAGVNLQVGQGGTGSPGVTIASNTSQVVFEKSTVVGNNLLNDRAVAVAGNITVGDLQISEINAEKLLMGIQTAPIATAPTIGTMSITNVTMDNITREAMNITGVEKLTIENIELTNADSGGFVQLIKDLTVNNYNMSLNATALVGGPNTGFGLFTGIEKAVVTNVTIEGNGGLRSGITIGASGNRQSGQNGGLVFDNINISNVGRAGIFETGAHNPTLIHNVTITNSTFTNVGEVGIGLHNQRAGSTVIISDNTFTNVAPIAPGQVIVGGTQAASMSGTGNVVTNSGVCQNLAPSGTIFLTRDGNPEAC